MRTWFRHRRRRLVMREALRVHRMMHNELNGTYCRNQAVLAEHPLTRAWARSSLRIEARILDELNH